MLPLLIGAGALYLWSKARAGGGGNGGAAAPLIAPRTAYVPWSAAPPSQAGSSGSGQTSPLSAFLGTFTRGFSTPAPYVPLSGPGGSTTSPGASGAPAGSSTNTLLPTSPGTVPDNNAVRGDMSSLANPQFWWMGAPIDVAIMSEDVGGAMARASGMDLTPIFVEASMGMVLDRG